MNDLVNDKDVEDDYDDLGRFVDELPKVELEESLNSLLKDVLTITSALGLRAFLDYRQGKGTLSYRPIHAGLHDLKSSLLKA